MGELDHRDLCAELLAFMTCKNRNELKCKKYLIYAQDILVNTTPIKFLPQEQELQGHFGPSDYMVRCVARNEAGIQRNFAYLWEVKAPQCWLFDKDTDTRAKPSQHLISAENQLLHYYHNLKNNQSLLTDFGLFAEDFHLGGIIIGSIENFTKGNFRSPEEATRLSNRAYMLREEYLYKRAGIKVITWNRILNQMQMVSLTSRTRTQESITGEVRTRPDDINIHIGGSMNIREEALAVIKRG